MLMMRGNTDALNLLGRPDRNMDAIREEHLSDLSPEERSVPIFYLF